MSAAQAANARAAAAQAKAAVAETRLEAEHASQIASCESGNSVRKGGVKLRNRLYRASTQNPESARQRQDNAKLIAYIRHLFADVPPVLRSRVAG